MKFMTLFPFSRTWSEQNYKQEQAIMIVKAKNKMKVDTIFNITYII